MPTAESTASTRKDPLSATAQLAAAYAMIAMCGVRKRAECEEEAWARQHVATHVTQRGDDGRDEDERAPRTPEYTLGDGAERRIRGGGEGGPEDALADDLQPRIEQRDRAQAE